MPWDEARAARAAYERDLFAKANVVGVAVARKVIRGRATEELCVAVYVERKQPESALRPNDIVPKVIDGSRTDVVETGRFRALAITTNDSVSRTKRMRPAPGGVSIGHVGTSAGTLGVLARRRDGQPVILSNNHVLANSNRGRPGDLILQPGPADSGTEADAIARLADLVPIAFIGEDGGAFARIVKRVFAPLLSPLGLALRRLPRRRMNLVDAAIAEPLAPDLVTPEILEIGRVSGTAAASIDLPVRKSGRTTGLTTGRVTGLDAVVRIDYGARAAMFRDQIVSDIDSKGGDSGSLVVDAQRRAVGLLFAGSPVTTLLNPIGAVLEGLRLEL